LYRSSKDHADNVIGKISRAGGISDEGTMGLSEDTLLSDQKDNVGAYDNNKSFLLAAKYCAQPKGNLRSRRQPRTIGEISFVSRMPMQVSDVESTSLTDEQEVGLPSPQSPLAWDRMKPDQKNQPPHQPQGLASS
jgi:hypothetical protein